MVFDYTRKELKSFLIVILVLAFVFAFNDGRETFEWGYWLGNFIKVLAIIAIGMFVHDLGHDLISSKEGFNSEFRVWGIKRLGFKEPTYPKVYKFLGRQFHVEALPVGIILALTVTFLSNGQLYWAAVSSFGLVTVKAHRLGRKFVETTDYEDAKIAIAGPMAMTFLAIILKIFNGTGIFDNAIFIYSVIIIYDMLPLPGLDGFHVLIGSKPLYAFGTAFIVSAALLIHYLSGIFALLLAVPISLAVGISYFYFFVHK